MTETPRPTLAVKPRQAPPSAGEPMVDSAALLGGRQELIIRHGDALYRLRLTASNKLILTK